MVEMPVRFETARAWAALLCRSGADDRAAKLLARLAADYRWAGEPFRRVAADVLKDVPPDAAAKVVGWCRPLVERDPGGLGWVADCYAAIGKTAEAEAVFVAATQAASATADDWARLVVHHASVNRQEAMTAALTSARHKLTPDGTFLMDRRSKPDFGDVAKLQRGATVRVSGQRASIVGAFELGAGFSWNAMLLTSEETYARTSPRRTCATPTPRGRSGTWRCSTRSAAPRPTASGRWSCSRT